MFALASDVTEWVQISHELDTVMHFAVRCSDWTSVASQVGLSTFDVNHSSYGQDRYTSLFIAIGNAVFACVFQFCFEQIGLDNYHRYHLLSITHVKD